MSRARIRDRMIIDGAHGEGGGQILRTALSLATITGRPLRIEHIRGARRNPGLAAQHLTAVRAAAALCGAQLSDDTLGSTRLEFVPEAPIMVGNYVFDVSLAREGGSAGAVMLVLQTVMLPLAFATGDSGVELYGGTHMAWSPPFDYVRDVWLPALARLGVEASVELTNWGWYPVGKGEVRARIRGLGGPRAMLKPLELEERGALLQIFGRAVAANLPAHIPQRMADRARSLLAVLGADLRIGPLRVRAACPGAGLFLTAEYANLNRGSAPSARSANPPSKSPRKRQGRSSSITPQGRLSTGIWPIRFCCRCASAAVHHVSRSKRLPAIWRPMFGSSSVSA